ncbi:MAG TPA: hypothetical protein DCR40_10370 [Prolixibacteraceae bacterium]|nr:hypothetical protein [Prolixibacteraceae bacterium]
MKRFIALCIFAIGMLVVWPPGEQARAANSDQVCFVVDHQFVAPASAMVQDNYIFSQIGNVNTQSPLVCRKGGGVEVQVLNLVAQPTNLINQKVTKLNFTQYCKTDLRLCRYSMRQSQNFIQRNIVSVHPVRIRADTSV